jgi:hypothetical protein
VCILRESYAKAYRITPAPRIDTFSNIIDIGPFTPRVRVKPRGMLRTKLNGFIDLSLENIRRVSIVGSGSAGGPTGVVAWFRLRPHALEQPPQRVQTIRD